RKQRPDRLPCGVDPKDEPQRCKRDNDRDGPFEHAAPVGLTQACLRSRRNASMTLPGSGRVEQVGLRFAYLPSMRAAAASSASLGVWRALVMFSSAEAIDDQNLPIAGIFGIGSPRLAFSIVALMFAFSASSLKKALFAGVPSGTSALMVFRPSSLSTLPSRN